jgi:hypothetical protein
MKHHEKFIVVSSKFNPGKMRNVQGFVKKIFSYWSKNCLNKYKKTEGKQE